MRVHPIAAITVSLVALFGSRCSAAPLYRLVNLGLSSAYTYGTGINNSGQVIGTSETVRGGVTSGFAYSNGAKQSLQLGSNTYPMGINDSGEIVGYYTFGGSDGRAFTDSGGAINTNLPTLGGFYNVATASNAVGDVVGYSTTTNANNFDDPFIYSGGIMTDLGFHGIAYGINASGQIVGTIGPQAGGAFVYSNGTMTDIGKLPGASYAVGLSINAAGEVVGWDQEANGDTGFVYNGGVMTALPTFGGGNGKAFGINDLGQFVGEAQLANASFHAFLDSDGTMYDLNNLLDASGAGWNLSSAVAINNNGWILVDGGSPFANSFNTSAALLIPVPEPSSLLLILIGGLALAVAASRKRGCRSRTSRPIRL